MYDSRCKREEQTTLSHRPNLIRNLLRGAAILLAAFAGVDAQAQLRGLGGPSIGSGVPSIGAPSSSTAGPSLGTSIPIDPVPLSPTLPTVRNPTVDGLSGRVNTTVTNTIDGAGNQLGRATDRIGDTVNAAARNLGPRPLTGPRASRVPPAGERRFVNNEVLVGLPSSLSAQALDALSSRHRLTRLQSHNIGLIGTTFHRWQIADQRPVADVVRALEADGGVSVAQPNYRFTLQQSQFARVTGEEQYALAKLRLPEAHRLATGGKVLVAVIDNGIDTSHPELAGMIAGSFDAVDRPEPPAHHGTGMAGAIVAHARLTGVAPAARILAIRAFAATGVGEESTTIAILRSIDWAVANGARVINMSFAGPQDPEIARSLAAASRKGIVLVAAAGNAGPKSGLLYPAADPNVIAVTATDSEDKLFALSNRGRHVAVSAPGVDVLVPGPGGTYQMTTGTSVAAAHVSGVVALLLEVKPSLTPQAVRNALASTAKDLGPKGRDDQFGAGLADAYRAVQSLKAARAPTASAAPVRAPSASVSR
ncbi:MAG: hypothetical protein QOG83_2297 [Alphaproteobacteria bacterium]|nr:hypothetical protein [Alphaproteobacteria bacterium]